MRTLVLGLLVLSFLLVSTPALPAADENQVLVDKAIEAHGGLKKLRQIKAAHTKNKGTIELLGGIQFTQDAYSQDPSRIKSVIVMDVMGKSITQTVVYDGKKGWINRDGKTIDMDDKTLEEVREDIYSGHVILLAALKEGKYELSSLGEVKVNGKPAVGVKISSKGHRDINLYFDKESKLVAKIERRANDLRQGNEITKETIITEYQDMDGIKIPKKILVNHDGKKYAEVETTEVKFVAGFDDSVFAKP